MYASNLGSTNNSDDVQVSTILPQNIPTTSTDNTPLVSATHGPATSNILRKMSGIFRVPTRQTESGYVEFGHLENQNIVSSINNQYTESIIDGNTSQKKTLGTFNGVFSPVALSMFSALVFIRVGYIVGNAGLLVTLLQFGIAYGILIFTVASVCAISTNGAVEGGGAYFMISRTLGPEFGGSIGTLFFLANIVSSALCISGCTEGLVENFGPTGYLIKDGSEGFLNNSFWYQLLYCTALNAISLALCVIGATMFAKTSVLILAIVTLSLGSVIVSFFIMDPQEISVPSANTLIIQNKTYHVQFMYTGLNKTTFKDNIYPQYGRDYTSLLGDQISFAAVFGVLFSGVTGIMAGANMSGELRNPGRSIPVGTLSAVAFTLVIYLSLSVLTAATCTRDLLQNNYMYMMPINIWSPFVAIGVLTATFSAALSNLIGGSRVLLALAKDKVFGSFLNFISKGTFRGNPIVAVIVSWALVQLMLFIGSLNLIAQINSVLFLLSYLATNLACVGLQLTSAPNFRPTYTYFSVHTATFGLLGTIAMMFVISPAYAGLSIAACITLVAGLHLFASTDRGDKDAPYWGSISQALIFHQVRKYLLMLDSRKNHVKYWRPQILLLVSSPRSCCPLIDFVNDIKKSGLFVLGHVFVPKNGNEPENVLDVTKDPSNKQYPLWLELIDYLKVKAFVELTTASTIREGFQHLVRISGMGAMKPNTIVLGFYDNKKPIDFFNSESSYKTTLFDSEVFNGGDSETDTFPLQNKKQLDPVQYVLMVSDVLNMGKNVCLARHFDRLQKSSIPKNRDIQFIDVWTMNVLKPFDMDGATTFDTNSLFMMQLATICNMVSVWKKLKIRIFVRVKSAEDILRLEELLKLFRIRATVHEIQNWSEIANELINVNEEQRSDYDDTDDEQTDKSQLNMNYIKQLNQIIKEKSGNCTAVSFIYLPSPPNFKGNPPYENEFIRFNDSYLANQVQSEYFEANDITYNCFDRRHINLCHNYLKVLTELTENLPPTVLVHGLNAVTSTTL